MSSGHSGIGRGRRFRILERDDFTCQYCGRRAPEVSLEVDHMLPRSWGGSNDDANLVSSCFDCNQGKKDSHDTRGVRTPHGHHTLRELYEEYLGAIVRIADLEDEAEQLRFELRHALLRRDYADLPKSSPIRLRDILGLDG